MSKLSAIKIQKVTPKAKEYTLADGEGLYLHIKPNGSKIWKFRFYWNDVQAKISFGAYPTVDLKTARTFRNDAKSLLARGIDPRDERKAVKAKSLPKDTLAFKKFAHQWVEFKMKKLGHDKATGRKSTLVQITRAMDKEFLPSIGHMALEDITRADVVKIIRSIENRKAFTVARKCRGWLNEMFRHALGEGLIDSNPASDLDVIALPTPPIKNNPYLKMAELPEFLAKLSNYHGYRQTMLEIKLLLLTGVRTGELRYAEPKHFDLENDIWRVPPDLVKQLQMRVRTTNDEIPPYLVPLSRQAMEIVKELMSMRYPWQQYLLCHHFEPKKVISENTLNYGIHGLSYKGRLTGHGIRATISTALNELGYESKWIEAQLAKSGLTWTPNPAQVVTALE